MGLGITVVMVFPAKISSSTKPQVLEFLEPDLIAAEKLYEQSEKEKTQTFKSQAFNKCSCVSAARYYSGIDFPSIGLAKNLPIQGHIAIVGAIGITNESNAGHLIVVKAINGEMLTIKETNYIPCTPGERQLNINDNRIVGYFYGSR